MARAQLKNQKALYLAPNIVGFNTWKTAQIFSHVLSLGVCGQYDTVKIVDNAVRIKQETVSNMEVCYRLCSYSVPLFCEAWDYSIETRNCVLFHKEKSGMWMPLSGQRSTISGPNDCYNVPASITTAKNNLKTIEDMMNDVDAIG